MKRCMCSRTRRPERVTLDLGAGPGAGKPPPRTLRVSLCPVHAPALPSRSGSRGAHAPLGLVTRQAQERRLPGKRGE